MSELVQYYLVDATLKMRKGKTGAQCGHGALLAHSLTKGICDYGKFYDYDQIYYQWFSTNMAKIVLKSCPEEMDRAKAEFKMMLTEVFDNGRTEIAPNTRTVVVLPVLFKENAPEWIRNLPLY